MKYTKQRKRITANVVGALVLCISIVLCTGYFVRYHAALTFNFQGVNISFSNRVICYSHDVVYPWEPFTVYNRSRYVLKCSSSWIGHLEPLSQWNTYNNTRMPLKYQTEYSGKNGHQRRNISITPAVTNKLRGSNKTNGLPTCCTQGNIGFMVMGRFGNNLYMLYSAWVVANRHNMCLRIPTKTLSMVFNLYNESVFASQTCLTKNTLEFIPLVIGKPDDKIVEYIDPCQNIFLRSGVFHSTFYFNISVLQKLFIIRNDKLACGYNYIAKQLEIQGLYHRIYRPYSKNNLSVRNITLIAIHWRLPESSSEARHSYFKFSYAHFIKAAMNYFETKYKHLCYIFCSSNIRTAKRYLGSTQRCVIFSEDNSREVDFALLTQADHFVMTVGTFGRWVAYSRNSGETVYPIIVDDKNILRNNITTDQLSSTRENQKSLKEFCFDYQDPRVDSLVGQLDIPNGVPLKVIRTFDSLVEF